jgi:hypothetical protein
VTVRQENTREDRKETVMAKTTVTPTVNLPEFAKKVMQIARYAPESARFGPNKVYISKVWEIGFSDRISLEAFKELLKQASIQGLIYLSRADLVKFMDQKVLQDSEIQLTQGSLTHTVHFVLVV